MRLLFLFLFALCSLKADVKTPEDHQRLAFFQSIKGNGHPQGEIPKVLHVIWLETRALPKKMLHSWIEKHPDWIIKVWSETACPLPHPSMRLFDKEAFPLGELEACYYDAESMEERVLILRYAILLSEGGVAIHPDLECVASLEPLRGAHDFFCGLKTPGHTFQSSSVQPGCELIGATPGHPILSSGIEWMRTHWKTFEADFPGTDPFSIQSRIQHRCAYALSVGIEREAGGGGRSDTVFAPHFFYGSKTNSVYAMAPKSLFRRQEQADKEKLQDAFKDIHRQLRLSFLLIIVLGALNLVLAAVIVYLYLKRSR